MQLFLLSAEYIPMLSFIFWQNIPIMQSSQRFRSWSAERKKKCLCLRPNVLLVPGWIGSMCCNWCCRIVLNIAAFWEQKSPEMKLTQIQLYRDVAHLCFILSALADLCLYDLELQHVGVMLCKLQRESVWNDLSPSTIHKWWFTLHTDL